MSLPIIGRVSGALNKNVKQGGEHKVEVVVITWAFAW